MRSREAAIRISRTDNHLANVSVIMPIWSKLDPSDGKLYISIPLFGLKTVATDENDVQDAVQESIKCFCIAAEKHGLGLESELEYVGWEQLANKDGQLIFETQKSTVMDSIMETADEVAFNLEVC